MDFRKQVREVGVTPLAPNRLAEAGPKELSRRAREEDVVSILHRVAKEAHPVPRSITLTDHHTSWEAAANPLPHEDPDLQGQADIPNQTKGLGGRRGGDGRVEGFGGEAARWFQEPRDGVRGVGDVHRKEGDVLEEDTPSCYLRGGKGAVESEAP